MTEVANKVETTRDEFGEKIDAIYTGRLALEEKIGKEIDDIKNQMNGTSRPTENNIDQ